MHAQMVGCSGGLIAQRSLAHAQMVGCTGDGMGGCTGALIALFLPGAHGTSKESTHALMLAHVWPL